MAKLTTSFNISNDNFLSKDLKIGEMMEINLHGSKGTHVIIKTYDRYVSLNAPETTWELGSKLYGRKLLPGESITLTQE